MVMPASRMLSAISLGVFCRSAPSTSAIMRSRKEEPGEEVMRTTIQSEMTVVPPVTAERSPPASRMTGADSPVIAASLTDAMPSITSPSPGMMSPASTSTKSPGRRSSAETVRDLPRLSRSASRLAFVSVRVRRKASACARPRPSAIASAKLANSTVNHSHSGDLPGERSRAARRQIANEQHRDERRHDRGDEDHRVLDQCARIELAEGIDGGAPDERRIGDGAR